MAIQSKEFVGIAEGIKSHELSTKGRIESLRGTISELSSRRSSLNSRLSYLEAALAAAYEDTDEDGDPDYGRISAIESEISYVEDDLSDVETELDITHGELSETQAELAEVMEKKAQTLFEIQERARKTSQNISIAGGMYGAYSGVGGSLQSSMQSSFASLSQAASILDGSVDSISSGSSGGGGGGGTSAGGRSISSQGDLSTSALSAFAVGMAASSISGGSKSAISAPSTFTSKQTNGSTPASMATFQSGQQSINPQKTLNFKTEQSENSYAVNSFGDENVSDAVVNAENYRTEQVALGIEDCFMSKDVTDASKTTNSSRGDLQKRREWAKQYQVGFTPKATQDSTNKSQKNGTVYRGERQKQYGSDTDYEYDDGFISRMISGVRKKKEVPQAIDSNDVIASMRADKDKFLDSLKVQVEKDVKYDPVQKRKPTSSGDPWIGPRERELVHETYMELGVGSLSLLAGVTKFFKRNEKEAANSADITAHSTAIKNQILLSAQNHIAIKYKWGFKDRTYTLQEDLKAVNPNFYDADGDVTYDDRWTRNCQRCIVAFEMRCRGVDVQAKERVLDGTDTLPIMNHPNGWLSVFKNAVPVNCSSHTGLTTSERVKENMANWGDGSRAVVRIQRCDTIKLKDPLGNLCTYAVETVNGRTVICDIVTRKEIDISKTYPNIDLSSGVEVMIAVNPNNPNCYERILRSKKSGEAIGHLQSHGGHVFTAIQHNGKTIFCDAQTGKIINDPSNYFLLAKREETYVVRVDNVSISDRAFDCCKPVNTDKSNHNKTEFNDVIDNQSPNSNRNRAPPQ